MPEGELPPHGGNRRVITICRVAVALIIQCGDTQVHGAVRAVGARRRLAPAGACRGAAERTISGVQTGGAGVGLDTPVPDGLKGEAQGAVVRSGQRRRQDEPPVAGQPGQEQQPGQGQRKAQVAPA